MRQFLPSGLVASWLAVAGATGEDGAAACFEMPYKLSGMRAVEYMATDAFSPERIASGQAFFSQRCAVCHTLSGRDLVMFGDPEFNAARVISATHKFSGASADPEIGEKIYEYLRFNFPGPFQSQHDPIMQPGPDDKFGPGKTNPILSENTDLWGALTGHRFPTAADLDLPRIWHDYEWPRILVSFDSIYWSEWLPHLMPSAADREYVLTQNAKLLARTPQERAEAGLQASGFRKAGQAGIPTDHWHAVLDFDYSLPSCWDPSQGWKGDWVFGFKERDIIFPTGFHFRHTDWRAINKQEKISSNSRMAIRWYLPPLFWSTGKEAEYPGDRNWDPVANPKAANFRPDNTSTYHFNWGCQVGEAFGTGGADYAVLNAMKYWAEIWYHSQVYHLDRYSTQKKEIANYGLESRKATTQVQYPWEALSRLDPNDNRAKLKPFLLEFIYQNWKAAIGFTPEELAQSWDGKPYSEFSKRYHNACTAFANLRKLLTPDEQDFFQVYIRRFYKENPGRGDAQSAQRWESFASVTAKPVILPVGRNDLDADGSPLHNTFRFIAGRPNRIKLLRAQTGNDDLVLTAPHLPSGAKLTVVRGAWIYPKENTDNDYFLDWAPAGTDVGRHSVMIQAAGVSSAAITIHVVRDDPPLLDAIPDKIVYVGQELTFPLTVRNHDNEGFQYSMEGGLGEVIQNAGNTAGIYSLRLDIPEAVQYPEKSLGDHRVKFTVRDRDRRQASTSARITVRSNRRPTFAITSPSGHELTGPGHFKNMVYAKVGDTLQIEVAASDPDGDPVEISKTVDFPGYIQNNRYSFVVDAKTAAEHPGPNVLTLIVKDYDAASDPRFPRYKSSQHIPHLVFFEPKDAPVNHSPWAVAGQHQTITSGATMVLDATDSFDMDRQPIRYHWSQHEGEKVSLSSDSSVKTTFVAPTVTEPVILKFQLTVKDPLGLADSAVVRIKVLPAGTAGY